MPKKVRTPHGVISVPDDVTPQELEALVNDLDSQQGGGQQQPQAQAVAADEPDTWLGGALKGFREGAVEGIANVGKAIDTVHPLAGRVAGALIPQFAKELRVPTAKEGRGLASSLAAGVASGAAVAASPFTAGATLATLPLVAGAASAGTTKLLGGDNSEVYTNAALDAAGGALPGAAHVLKGAGRSLVRGAFGFKRGAAEGAVEESIRSGIGPSSRGMEKARDIINTLSDEVTKTAELLDQGRITATTGLQNMAKVRADAARQGATGEQLGALDNLIDTYRQRFSGTYTTAGAHQQKKELYKPIEATFDSKVPSHLNQAKQGFAAGFRTEVEKEAEREGLGSYVAPVNERIGNLITLEEQLAKQTHRGVGPIDAMLGLVSPKAEAARLAFMPAPRAFAGRQIARAGDVLGAITDPFVNSAARAGGQTGIGGEAAKRAAAASEAKIAQQRGIRDAARARRTEQSVRSFETTNPVEPGRGAYTPDDATFPVERPDQNIPQSWEEKALADFDVERAAQQRANAEAEAQLTLRGAQERQRQQRLRQENPEQLVLDQNPRDPQQLLLGDEFDVYTPIPGQVPDRTGILTKQELPWRPEPLNPVTRHDPFPVDPSTKKFELPPDVSARTAESHRTRVPVLAQSQALTEIPRTSSAIQQPSAHLDLPGSLEPYTPYQAATRGLSAGQGPELSGAWQRELGMEGDFGILTAANPGRTLSPAENAARNERLLQVLREEGYTDIVPQRGVFGGSEEPSFFVRGMTDADARRIGNAFGQVSVIGRGGYHRLADKTTFPSRGINVGQFDDNFSELLLPDGRKVQYQMDFPEEAFLGPRDVLGLNQNSQVDDAALDFYARSAPPVVPQAGNPGSEFHGIDTDALLREADALDAADSVQLRGDDVYTNNASGAGGSMEEISRAAGMRSRGEQWAIMGPGGKIQPYLSPDGSAPRLPRGYSFGKLVNGRFQKLD